MSIANVNQVAIFYELVGEGQPCLVMHGGLGIDHTYFRPWLDPLGNVLQLVYYDHRGNGRSTAAATHTMTHAQLAADADQLCAHLGLGQVVVLGHSYGGFIALAFALRYPKRVSHLVLMDTAASMAHAQSIEHHARRKGASEHMIALLKSAAVTDDAMLHQRLEALLPLYFKNWNETLAKDLLGNCVIRAGGRIKDGELRSYDVTSRLAELDMPTLVLVGQYDFICSPEQARTLADGINRAELTVFENSGHFPFVERREEFLCVLRTWICQSR